jgi:hypothetical protein
VDDSCLRPRLSVIARPRYQQLRSAGSLPGPVYGNVQARVTSDTGGLDSTQSMQSDTGGGGGGGGLIDLHKNEVFNGELQTDCLTKLRGDGGGSSPPSPSFCASSCYLHEVPAPAALGLGVAPRNPPGGAAAAAAATAASTANRARVGASFGEPAGLQAAAAAADDDDHDTGAAPSTPLTNEQCNVVAQLQAKLGAWWCPFRESTPKFFAADP